MHIKTYKTCLIQEINGQIYYGYFIISVWYISLYEMYQNHSVFILYLLKYSNYNIKNIYNKLNRY